jgi:hypothetical protein
MTCPLFGKKFLGGEGIEIAHQEAKLASKPPMPVDAILRFLMR